MKMLCKQNYIDFDSGSSGKDNFKSKVTIKKKVWKHRMAKWGVSPCGGHVTSFTMTETIPDEDQCVS